MFIQRSNLSARSALPTPIISLAVSGFSEDGRWWWDGTTWVATAQVVLPELPMTEFERSGKLNLARADVAKGRRQFWTSGLLLTLINLMPANINGFREYRTWTIEQLALATAYLLGPDEPLLAGEVSAHDAWDAWTRDLAVAITGTHVLVFRIDSLDGQPRWIAMVGRANDVKIEARTGLHGYLWPALEISSWNGQLTIYGIKGEFEPGPLLEAWRQAAKRTPKAG
jgi:hypothetical protein